MNQRTTISKKNDSKSSVKQTSSSKTAAQPVFSPQDALLQLQLLQRQFGNKAVQGMYESGMLQAKLKIGEPNDVYEQEADSVAERVMSMPDPGISGRSTTHGTSVIMNKNASIRTKPSPIEITPLVQRQNETAGIQMQPEEEEEPIKGKFIQRSVEEEEEPVQGKLLQPREEEEEELPIQGKADVKDNSPGVLPSLENRINSLKGGGSPMSDNLKAYFEPRFGYDFGGVRLHTDSRAAETARAVNAQAFTLGSDIAFGPGKYSPETTTGKLLLAHELTPVVQQGERNFIIQRMMSCPRVWPDPIPPGWQRYHGDPNVFHCGFRGILEARIPTPDDPQNECFYDHSGLLVDENHPYAGCRGTPNQYDSADSPVSHTLRDTGGILHAGAPAFITSRIYDVSQAIAGAVRVVETIGTAVGSIFDALGQAILEGVLTAKAIVSPLNWTFRGLPSRSIRHLNVIGGILSSISWNRNLDELLTNITRRLDSFPIEGLINEITEDINQALTSGDRNTTRVNASDIGAVSLLRLIDWLNSRGIIEYIRPPEEIAREELNEMQRQ